MPLVRFLPLLLNTALSFGLSRQDVFSIPNVILMVVFLRCTCV